MNLKQRESFYIFEKNKKQDVSDSFFLEKKELSQIKKPFQKIPFLSGFAIKTGVLIGHKSLRLSKTNYWHPLMAHYFLGIRNGIALINPTETRKCLLRAFYIIALVLKTKSTRFSLLEKNKEKPSRSLLQNNKGIVNKINKTGHILIVNTNPEFFKLCKILSRLTLHNNEKLPVQNFSFFYKKKESNFNKNLKQNFEIDFFKNVQKNQSLSFVHYKWVGGTLTNWKQVSKSVLTYAKFAERCEKFLYHNNIDFPRYKKIKECFHGLITKKQGKVYLAFNEKPDLVFLMNPNENRHIIAEANKMHIPVIALVESNTCLNGISYPIPANAYSVFFIYYCLKKIIKLTTI